MMRLHELENSHRPAKKTKLLGRGLGSGRGKTCTRGHKGHKARAGYKAKLGYEGGQTPLYRRVPTRGSLVNRFREDVFALNIDVLNRVFNDGEVVSFQTLLEKGILSKTCKARIKILAGGELTKKLTFEGVCFSEAAQQKIANSNS